MCDDMRAMLQGNASMLNVGTSWGTTPTLKTSAGGGNGTLRARGGEGRAALSVRVVRGGAAVQYGWDANYTHANGTDRAPPSTGSGTSPPTQDRSLRPVLRGSYQGFVAFICTVVHGDSSSPFTPFCAILTGL